METGTHSTQKSKDTGQVEDEFTIVERVARIVSTVRGTKPDYTRLAAELEQALPFDIFGVVLLRHDRQAVRVTVSQRGGYEDSSWKMTHHQLPLVDSMLESIIRVPTIKVINAPEGLNGLPSTCGDALSGQPQLRSALIVPLLVEESEDAQNADRQDDGTGITRRVLGTLELGSVTLHIYDDKTIQRLIQAVAHVLATAIERAQLGGSAEIQNRQRQALKSVSSALAAKVDISTILQQIVAGIEQALGVASSIMLLDPLGETLHLGAFAGFERAAFSHFFEQDVPVVDEYIAGYTVRRRQPVSSPDIALDEHFSRDYQLYEFFGIHSMYSYPLMSGVTVYGVLILYSPEPGGFTPLKIDILSLFASQATIAIHNDMLLQSTRNMPQGSFTDTLRLLTRTAETALTRSGMLGELGGLLMHLRQSINSVRDAWFVVDKDGICVYMNPSSEALCKLHMEEVVGLSLEHVFASLLPRLRNADEVRLYLQDFSQGNVYSQQLRCVLAIEPIHIAALEAEFSEEVAPQARMHPSSSYERHSLQPESTPSDYHYQLVRYPLHNEHEQLVGNALQMQDVTEQVRDEKNRSALLSSMSHDLRTPLTTIKAAVTGLLQQGLSWNEQEIRAILEDIDTETDHLTVLVTAVIELSRIEMGALTLKKEWCDIVEIIYGSITKAERILAGHPVYVHALPSLPLVYVDYVQMNRVIYNLLENAARHSPDHAEIVMNVDTYVQPGQKQADKQWVRVQVIDHGSGVPEHERERIFKSFYGLRSRGSGLGLAICKGIIEAHRGRIWVESFDTHSVQKASHTHLSPTQESLAERAQTVLDVREVPEEEDIVARITRKLAQQKVQEGACFIFTLPTYSASSAHDEESPTLERHQ